MVRSGRGFTVPVGQALIKIAGLRDLRNDSIHPDCAETPY
jgi:hypothetical protein